MISYSTSEPNTRTLNVTLSPNETRVELADVAVDGKYNVSIVGVTACDYGPTSEPVYVINDGKGEIRETQ